MALLYPDIGRSSQRADSGFGFGVVGNAGADDEGQRRIAGRMAECHTANPWSFVLSLGDNISRNVSPRRFEDNLKSAYRPLLRTGAAIHCCLGDADCAAGFAWAQVRDDAFGFVGRQDEYVFDASDVGGAARARFLCLNSCAWLDALKRGDDLEIELRIRKLRRRLAESADGRWRVLYLHHPLYSYSEETHSADHKSKSELCEIIEPEIAGRVDLVLGGHEPFYQKIRPILGAHHFVSGGGSHVGVRRAGAHPDVEFAASRRHFLDFRVFEDGLVFQAIDEHGQIFHSGVIERSASLEREGAANPQPAELAYRE